MTTQTVIIPALDLIDGNIVRLKQGDYAKQSTYVLDPVAQVQAYIQQGAKHIHLVDLDGAKDVTKRQLPLLQKLLANIQVCAQVGGGIRTSNDIQQLLAIGVTRVVIGTTAISAPEKVAEWLKYYGNEHIVLALDINIINQQKLIATNGWQQQSNTTIEQCLQYYLTYGLKYVLCTDISKDGTLQGANIQLYRELKQQYPQIAWQASGGVANLDDIKQLKALNLDGIIVGKSLLENKFNVKDAIIC